MSRFEGFPKKTLTFLRGLSRNNTKEWFEDHRADYEQFWLEPARDFVETAGPALQKVAPVSYSAKVNGSILRINRDVRFSKDKRPYKDHLDFWFWEGDRKSAVSGFFLRLTARHLGIGVGAHGFEADRLGAYRSAVVDPKAWPSLIQAKKKVEKAGYLVRGEHYKRTPAGFEPVGADQERLLRFAALWCGEDVPVPADLHRGAIVKHSVAEWKKLEPVHRWLVDNLQG